MCDTVRDNFFCSEKWLRLLSVSDLPSAVAESPSWQPTARRTSPTRKEEQNVPFSGKAPEICSLHEQQQKKKTPRARAAPHAGYEYSGPGAAGQPMNYSTQ
jgi:hypothetical protein